MDVAAHRARHGSTPLEPPPSAVAVAWTAAIALPVAGFLSLLARSQLDPEWSSARLHFVLFLSVGAGAFVLASIAGQAAEKRGDARVFLLSLAFLLTGGFLAVHAIGTPGVLLNDERPGFSVAIPIGLLVAAVFACGSAFVDVRPGLAPLVFRRRHLLRGAVLAAMAVWSLWSLLQLPPLAGSNTEGAGVLLKTLAALGAATYAIAAMRYVAIYHREMILLPTSVVACFTLLAEAMFGSALVGERTWHASWWEWHCLIVTAYVVVLYAARRQWREERFHQLYLPSTRHRTQAVSVLFADLVAYTTFAERNSSAEIARMLSAYYGLATPLIAERFGGEVEKFMGDAIMATFNTRGDQPDHALRATRAGLELQRQMAVLGADHPDWPRLRVGVNSGDALVRELGGRGFLDYAVVGDAINVASRLEGQAPVGGVLVGAGTYRELPGHVTADPHPGLRVKGKQATVDAYLVHSVAA
jgi:class 3 adenylate cyclase